LLATHLLSNPLPHDAESAPLEGYILQKTREGRSDASGIWVAMERKPHLEAARLPADREGSWLQVVPSSSAPHEAQGLQLQLGLGKGCLVGREIGSSGHVEGGKQNETWHQAEEFASVLATPRRKEALKATFCLCPLRLPPAGPGSWPPPYPCSSPCRSANSPLLPVQSSGRLMLHLDSAWTLI
jgi:hypothetical protein